MSCTISDNSTKTSLHGCTQATTIDIKYDTRVIIIVPSNESINLINLKIIFETKFERIYHTVNVVGETTESPGLVVKNIQTLKKLMNC